MRLTISLSRSPAIDEAVKLSRDTHYTVGEAEALLMLSERQNLDNHATAVLTAQEALGLWKNLNDRDGIARTYNKLGTFYLAQNLQNEAGESFGQALALWRGLNDNAKVASVLISLGFVEFRKADWEACISYLGQAYPMVDERLNLSRWVESLRV